MQKYTNTVPFFHTIYTGLASERTDVITPQILDQFYETDTGAGYIYSAGWTKNSQNGVPLTVVI